MKDWYNFYKQKQTKKYLNYIKKQYAPFVSLLKRESKKVNTIMEIGCGLCNITNALDIKNKNVIVVDRNNYILQFANTNAFKICRNITQAFTHKADLIHSHGVLEHLNDQEIQKTIREQLKVGIKLIHYVPSNKYNYKSFGDERLMSIEQWRSICKPDKITEFNNGYDLILEWG